GGVAQLLGVWLAGDEHLEALRAGGSEGILFDEAEVEGRGMREALTALTVLGVMMGGTLTADAGLFSRSAKKEVRVTQKSNSNRQAPIRVNSRALSDTSSAQTMVIVDISKQRAYLLADGKIIVDTPVSTARSGKYTPRGEFKITQRVEKGKTSTIYGCELPYWMRLDQSAIGMHIGDLPGYPASAGCIRLPAEIAPVMYKFTKSGTTVKVMNSWQNDATVASR
ncbi:MAG: L,D-transpeptidase, partial [Verrucomicrobiales bacterium]